MPIFIDAIVMAFNALLLLVGLAASAHPAPAKPLPIEHTECVQDAVDPAAKDCRSVPGPAPR